MGATTRGRLVSTNQVVIDQTDFYTGDGFTRVVGLGVNDVASQLFYNNQLQSWLKVLGTSVPDALISAGTLYWNEIPGSPGFYSVRFRPNAAGYWRLIVTYAAGTQLVALNYDVAAQLPAFDTGLTATFTKP